MRRELELDRLGLPPPPKAPPIAAPPMGVALLKTRDSLRTCPTNAKMLTAGTAGATATTVSVTQTDSETLFRLSYRVP